MDYDVIIVGAGPAGLSAAYESQKNNLNYVVLEKDKIANTLHDDYYPKKCVWSYPTYKLPEDCLPFKTSLANKMLETWTQFVKEKNFNIKEGQKVLDVKRFETGFKVITTDSEYSSKYVIIATGVRVNPRKLGVSGEELDKVLYRMNNPEDIHEKNILVVGGGDTAVEIAFALADSNNTVTISYRKEEFFRLVNVNKVKVNKYLEQGKLDIIYKSTVKEITGNSVVLDVAGEEKELKNDLVIICIGASPNKAFFEKIGVTLENNYPFKKENLETNIDNLFIAGDITGCQEIIQHAIDTGIRAVESIIKKEKE